MFYLNNNDFCNNEDVDTHLSKASSILFGTLFHSHDNKIKLSKRIFILRSDI